jgi:hypothetical protein
VSRGYSVSSLQEYPLLTLSLKLSICAVGLGATSRNTADPLKFPVVSAMADDFAAKQPYLSKTRGRLPLILTYDIPWTFKTGIDQRHHLVRQIVILH